MIRAHGVPPTAKQQLKVAEFNVIDPTCPRVIKVQTIIRKHAKKDYAAIIIGDKDHPEVIGLLGYARGKGYVVGSIEELEALPAFDNAIIVSQTTQNARLLDSVIHWASKNSHYKIYNTICDSTERRQAEVQRLAETVDAVIVVGGHKAAIPGGWPNCQQTGKPTYHIESEAELASIDAVLASPVYRHNSRGLHSQLDY